MYLKKLRLQNIKCFEDVTLEFPHRDGDYSGWNVILGTNGRGKTTILQVVASLLQDRKRPPLNVNVGSWSTQGKKGNFEGYFVYDAEEEDAVNNPEAIRPRAGTYKYLKTNQTTSFSAHFTKRDSRSAGVPQRKVLACGYGAHRRLTLEDYSETLPHTDPRFLTLFHQHTGLAGPLDWLPGLYAAFLDPKNSNHTRAKAWLKQLIQVFNQLLPDGVRIDDVTTEEVRFRAEPSSVRGDHQILGEGYRSFLALAGNLLEQVWGAYPEIDGIVRRDDHGWIQILAEGIVLIDEADAHLHPSWQRELGRLLCRVFPKIQFIVTTHSPFVAQEAADDGLFVLTEQPDGTVRAEKPVRSVRGWTASQILTSPLFGLESTRDPETEETIRTAADLTAKEQDRKLTAAEKKRLKAARDWLKERLSAPGETYEEMRRQQEMAKYIDDTLGRLENGHL